MSVLSGRTAIVTGASSGIGRATAEALARAGYTVFGTSRRAISNGPAQVSMLTCDVTDGDSVSALVATVLAQTGRIDLLVNDAGVGMLGGAEESSVAQVQSLFDVNLFGVMRMINAVLPSMRRRGQGRIINIGSILGLVPAPYSAHYSAVKHALEGYSESLDHEVRAFNIRVSIIEPAYVRTVFDQNGIEPDSVLKDTIRPEPGSKRYFAMSCPKPIGRKWWRMWSSRRRPMPVRGDAIPRARLRAKSACCAASPPRRCSTRPCASSSACRSEPQRGVHADETGNHDTIGQAPQHGGVKHGTYS